MANQLVHNILQRERESQLLARQELVKLDTLCVAKIRFPLSLSLSLWRWIISKEIESFLSLLKTTAFLSHDDHFQHSHSL